MSDFIFTLCNVEKLPIVTALFPDKLLQNGYYPSYYCIICSKAPLGVPAYPFYFALCGISHCLILVYLIPL